MRGTALTFDGNGDYAEIAKPMPTELRPPTALTLEAWIYPFAYSNAYSSTVSSALGGIIASQYESTAACYSMRLDYRTGAHGGVQGGIHFQVGGTSGWWSEASQGTTATAVPLNTWTHVACVAEAGQQYKVYFDGVLVADWNAHADIDYDDRCRLAIGWNDSASRYFNGDIDEVRIYSEARTQAEIQADYNATKP